MKILIVDDDELIANLIEQNLILEGFETVVCHDGITALGLAESIKPELIILDVMLPGMDGFHVCRRLQGSGIPIIMLTAKNDITDKLMGLETGADDYMVKPFDSRELVARVHTIFRRLARVSERASKNGNIPGNTYKNSNGNTTGNTSGNTSVTGEHACSGKNSEIKLNRGISISEETRIACMDNRELNLTPTEFNLLLLFKNNPGRVFTRAQLLDNIWGYDFLGDSRVVDIHIQRLRKKLGTYSNCIETAFGVGYRYKEQKNEA